MKEPRVEVGIISESQIEFILHNDYLVNGKVFRGKQSAFYKNGHILWNDSVYDELLFEPTDETTGVFELLNVTIGIHFHWERKENQCFLGALKFIVENNQLTGINIIHVEDYLTSVISSEMSAKASIELLKAHAVISRSWLLALLQKNKTEKTSKETSSPFVQTDTELIRWQDHHDHLLFDVCADDHCQRYQGITKESTMRVKQAIKETYGQVLMYNNTICDARFSKCCGGVLEEFSYCWEDMEYPYLKKRRDNGEESALPDLRIEAEAEKWIRQSPKAFCNTTDKAILSQVLNNYDQETADFYRWQVEYMQEELSDLIRRRTEIDFGNILDLVPIERGTSGRLSKLKIVGTKRTVTIGKELEIRHALSESHLYSSAFIVDKTQSPQQTVPEKFILTGAGWGHGVGLCQIGAAVMGEQGYSYKEILLHYYKPATIEQQYKKEE
ncbi:MAG: SpoIID/LytB domain-containing protein [Bacteroidaceae bacterium]|nr:SpoIID/LytB domain-containing protein [Bacteroidaceae bacterium]